ncbi:hypothetical protein AB6A40_005914 [Gnathostoma spinigerum]|uniref:Uncharacterized protein n=1 Tax=Gnathostoma spinigerum TaxID=75299 RepID=A0ABD6EGT6_9BILA
MSGIINGRARVVYSSPEFLHLSKGGLDGKIVAYRDSWVSKSFDNQDWVTFKAKAHDPEGTHGQYGVRYRALPNSVKFESKAKIVDGVGTLMKVDESQGQYGFIRADDSSTVYFTASVVRPETKDIRLVFKTGVQIRYRATEQKQNSVQWRAIAVCSKNSTIESSTGRQIKTSENSSARSGLNQRKSSVSLGANGISSHSVVNKTISLSNRALKQPNNVDSRSNSLSRSITPSNTGGGQDSAPLSPTLLSPSFPPLSNMSANPQQNQGIPFGEIVSTGDAYEDAVRRLVYFAHKFSENSCKYCLFR